MNWLKIGAALAAGLLLTYGGYSFIAQQRDIGRDQVRAEYAEQLAKAKSAALLRERELQTKVNEATKHATEREQTIRSLAAASAGAANGLRDTIAAIRDGLPAASGDAIRATARAYGEVLAECEGRRREVAEEAERINSEKRQLIEAWPTNGKETNPR